MATKLFSSNNKKLEVYKNYIRNFTSSHSSVNNYSDFGRINMLIHNRRSDFTELLDYDDPVYIQQIYDYLMSLDSFDEFKGQANENKNFKKIGNGQYHNALLQYIIFLKVANFMSTSGLHTQNEQIANNQDLADNTHIIPLQQIFYGAPGTGKSYKINEETKKQPKENVFRTTFHPDSDYSTFVGCYKPTKEATKSKQILDYDNLVDKLKEYLSVQPANITRSCALFGYDYHDSIVKMEENGLHTIPNLVADAYKSGTTYDTTVRAGMSVYESGTKEQKSSMITYTYVPQAFTKAYLRAWQTTEPVYLVIEEINRGNCAQIFGDLFQLLDRKNGVSEYPIKPDTDLGSFIAEKMERPVEGAPESVVNGEEMILPSNLYIWATMNTSDQSLFPIDSAFKRRWDWVYVPINENKEQWSIEVEGVKYSWSSFLKIVNKRIYKATSSEDKQLGFYFCKAEDNTITAEKFVSKVLFYLWNDVFKDYDEGESIFKSTANEQLTFSMFYNTDGSVNEQKVTELLVRLEKEKTGDDPDLTGEANEEDDDGNSTSSSTKDYSKYSVNGEGSYGKNRLASECVRKYVELNPEKTADEVYNIWISLGNIVPHFIETKEQYDSRTDSSKRSYEITIGNSSVFVAHNGYGSNGMVNVLIEKVNAKDWGIKIEKLNS